MNKYAIAMSIYAALALLAGVQLDGKMRLAVWIFLAGLAVKTWIAKKRIEQEDK